MNSSTWGHGQDSLSIPSSTSSGFLFLISSCSSTEMFLSSQVAGLPATPPPPEHKILSFGSSALPPTSHRSFQPLASQGLQISAPNPLFSETFPLSSPPLFIQQTVKEHHGQGMGQGCRDEYTRVLGRVRDRRLWALPLCVSASLCGALREHSAGTGGELC